MRLVMCAVSLFPLPFYLVIYKQIWRFSLYRTFPIQSDLVLNLLNPVNIYSVWSALSIQPWIIDKQLQ